MAKSKFSSDTGYQAFRVLQFVFVVIPILAGLDKFFHIITNWTHYLSPFALQFIDGHQEGFMKLVGIVEIVAGILVAFKPKIFSYIVSLWLLLIVLNLLMTGHYYDDALRDFGLMLSAFAFGRLSHKFA